MFLSPGLKCDRCHEEGQILTSEGCVVPDDMTTDPQEAETCDTKDCGKNGQCVVNDDDKAECTCDYECGDKVVSLSEVMYLFWNSFKPQ